MFLRDDYLRGVIAQAKAETESVEQRAIRLLHERGDMANFDNDGRRYIEARVRELLLDD